MTDQKGATPQPEITKPANKEQKNPPVMLSPMPDAMMEQEMPVPKPTKKAAENNEQDQAADVKKNLEVGKNAPPSMSPEQEEREKNERKVGEHYTDMMIDMQHTIEKEFGWIHTKAEDKLKELGSSALNFIAEGITKGVNAIHDRAVGSKEQAENPAATGTNPAADSATTGAQNAAGGISHLSSVSDSNESVVSAVEQVAANVDPVAGESSDALDEQAPDINPTQP